MKAGKTDIEVGTRIRTTKTWLEEGITGTITHPFGISSNAIAGIWIDPLYQPRFTSIGNLYEGDFEVIEEGGKK